MVDCRLTPEAIPVTAFTQLPLPFENPILEKLPDERKQIEGVKLIGSSEINLKIVICFSGALFG